MPFSIAYLIESLYLFITNKYDILTLLVQFFLGGKGPGSYYVPIMIQFVLIFPCIYFLIKKINYKGLLVCVMTNIIFEVLKLPSSIYRLLIFRYLTFIAFGCYIAIERVSHNYKRAIPSFIIGLAIIFLFNYTDFKPEIFNRDWIATNFLCILYIAPIFLLILNNNKCKNYEVLSLIGKSSFNIYLTQMVYFKCMPNSILLMGYISILANILVCVIIGIIFYKIENKITKRIINFIDVNM